MAIKRRATPDQCRRTDHSKVPNTTFSNVEPGTTDLPMAALRCRLAKGLGLCHIDFSNMADEKMVFEAMEKARRSARADRLWNSVR